MPALSDPAAIRAILSADPAWSVYALGDLAPARFERCSWFRDPTPGALALVYRGFTPPVLFTIGPAEGIARLAEEFSSEPAFHLHVRPEIVPVLAARYQVTGLKRMRRMVLDPSRFRGAGHDEAVRLRPEDCDAVERLYADGRASDEAPDFFFPPMIEDGVFFGIREEAELAAVAGTHLVEAGEGVAAVGNVYTRRDRRGRGLAARVTSAVVEELLRRGIQTIALNVSERNLTATRVYERLGFAPYCAFVEGRAERR
jgi:GNAT superfamily N-acetyltransferase